MYFSRAKTFLIILFIIVNIFLLNIIYSDYLNKNLSEDAISKTVSILSEKNISIDEKIIDKTSKNMFYLNLINPLSEESETKNKIKGKITYDNGFYTFIPENTVYEFNNLLLGSETSNEILKILEKHGIYSDYFVWDGTLDLGDGNYRATFYQTYESNRIYSSKINVFFNKNSIIKMEGNYFNLQSVNLTEKNIISPLEVLIRFSDYNFNERITVTSIETGYYTEEEYSSYYSLTATPCYMIKINNGNKYYFDATNSNFIELSEF